MINWIDPNLVQLLGLTLLHFVWQGLIVGALYATSLLLTRAAQAGSRYNLAVATLVVLALLPPMTFAWLVRQTTGITTAAIDGAEFMALLVETSPTSLGLSPLAWVVALWLAGVLMLSARLLLGWHYLVKLRRTADHVAANTLHPALNHLKHRFGIRRSVVLALSERIQSPIVVGWFKPLILLPPALMTRLPMDQIEMVLAHELAHIRRHDHLVNLFQTVVETLLFYHPVVAWVSRRIRIERENACDDLAVAATQKRLAYVEMLASLEHLRRVPTRFALGVQDGQVLGRIRRLVEPANPDGQRGLTLPAVLVVTLLAGAAGLQWLPEPVEAETETRPVDVLALELPPEPVASTLPETQAAVSPAPAADELTLAPSAEPLATASTGMVADEPPTLVQQAPAIEAPAPVPAGQEEAIERQSRPSLLTAPRPLARPEGPEADDRAPTPPIELAMLSHPAPLPEPIEQAPEPEPLVELSPPPITGGTLISQVQPEFPPRARMRRADGLVELEFLVDERGRVSEIEVLSEQPANQSFGQAAERAVAQWLFEPYRQGDQVISRRVRLEVEFSAGDGCAELLGSRIPRC